MDRNHKTVLAVLAVVLGMIALTYASVPLYRLFCQVTGYDGTTQVSQQAPSKIFKRMITVSLDARTDTTLPWDFKPEQRAVKLKIGQQAIASFSAINQSARPTVGTALYNVTPEKAGPYFYKTQCFCFAEQVLAPGKTAHFPVVFYIDPKIMDDPDMDDVSDITLSYTFFPANSERFDRAMQRYLKGNAK